MDEADAVEAQAQVEVEGPPEGDGSVRIYENLHCHVDRLPDGRYRVVSRKAGVVVGHHDPDRLHSALASANRVAGPPKRST